MLKPIGEVVGLDGDLVTIRLYADRLVTKSLPAHVQHLRFLTKGRPVAVSMHGYAMPLKIVVLSQGIETTNVTDDSGEVVGTESTYIGPIIESEEWKLREDGYLPKKMLTATGMKFGIFGPLPSNGPDFGGFGPPTVSPISRGEIPHFSPDFPPRETHVWPYEPSSPEGTSTDGPTVDHERKDDDDAR